MKLEDYKKLVEIQLLTEYGLNNILESNKAYQNNEIDKAFDNAKLFKPITDSNKELFDRIIKKTDQSDEIIKKITDSLTLNNQQMQSQEESQTQQQTEAQTESQTQETKEESQSIIDNKIKESKDFVDDIIKGKDVFLYTGKKGDVYTDVKLHDLNYLDKFTRDNLQNYLNSPQITSLTRQLNAVYQHHPHNKLIESYIKNFKEYKLKIKEKLAEKDNISVINEVDEKISETQTPDKDDVKDKISENNTQPIQELVVEGQGIKKRNGYKIENSKYDKLLINMDKLFNNYYVEAWFNDDIIYENQGDKDTVELLTKARINKKKKYSKLSQQIVNDMITLSGMIKKRN